MAKLIYFLAITTIALYSCTVRVDKIVSSNDFPNPPDLSSTLAFVFVDTYGQQIEDEPKVDSFMKIYTTQNNSIPFLPGGTTVKVFEGRIGIEIRGYSSSKFEKKSFGFETWDENKQDKKVSLIGFPEESDWILYAPYDDKSLVRNHLAYTLFRQMGHYASRTKFLELYLDTNSNSSFFPDGIEQYYQGVYMLLEKIKRDNDRVNVKKMAQTDVSGAEVTGGYIIKIDHLDSGEKYFNTDNGRCVTYDYPDEDAIVSAQEAYVEKYMNDFESALSGSNFKDTINGYAKYIDASTFIDYFLIQELFRNYDGFTASCYMNKDRDQKLKMGPVWDFNETISNIYVADDTPYTPWAPEGWLFNNPRKHGVVPFWWARLIEDPNYKSQLVSRWNELRAGAFSKNNLNIIIDESANLLSDAQVRNYEKWDILYTLSKFRITLCVTEAKNTGRRHGVWNREDDFIKDLPDYTTYKGYPDEVLLVKLWLEKRFNWMDSNIGAL